MRWVLVCLFIGCASTPAVQTPTVPSDVALVAAAMPSIVLVVNARDDHRTTYGAGFFDVRGRILTAHHVVADPGRVSVMLYRKGRATYSPMDGGILRFLFESSRELVPARVTKVDAVSDVALLEIDPVDGADTADNAKTARPALVWANEPVHPGERVFALGHPQETPWSFSVGVVGALQYGLIQHDATVGPGSSGGPLLNLRGEVVGMNVAQVVSEPVGLSFARPESVIRSALDGEGDTTTIDLTSATTSALSCWRAQELALREVADCFDWDTDWRQYQTLLDEAAAFVAAPERQRILACRDARAEWIARRREKVTRALDPTYEKDKDDVDPADPELPPEVAALLRSGLADAKRTSDATFDADFKDVTRLRTRLRQGLRVEDTRRVASREEWVLLGSKNADGSVAHFSELYVDVAGSWVQRGAPWPEEIARLPHGWPPPMETFAMKRAFGLAYLVKRARHGDACGPRSGTRAGFFLDGIAVGR